MALNKDIYVTQPSLPDFNEFTPYLKQIWKNRILTNNGPFHQEFEKELADFLGVPHISLFTNGTLALITALQVLEIKGEVITTPYSFVATTHSLWWNNIKPVFVDIESDFCNMDPKNIEAAINPKTTAILPVHVYGNPCDVERIQEVADKYGLKVIYDAAHAFGIKYNGGSLCNYGDLSVLSFHATKAFNTFEGGAIVSHDESTKNRIDYLKNFGFASETKVVAPGINSKMNEFQASLGILQLKDFKNEISKREIIADTYNTRLNNIDGLTPLMKSPKITSGSLGYYPIFINSTNFKTTRDNLYNHLKLNRIHSRRYFYPLISQFPMYKNLPSATKSNLPIADDISNQVICLPFYADLPIEIVDTICDTIIEYKHSLNGQ